MVDIAWFGKDKTHLHRFSKPGETPVSMSDVLQVAAGETLAVLGADGKALGVVGPGASPVSGLPFAPALGTPGVFGRVSVGLVWASAAPVETSGEWPLPPIADPGSNRPCSGASVRATYGLAVTDLAKLLAVVHTPTRPIVADAGVRAAKAALATAFQTFWRESREPIVTRQASMEEGVPLLAATVLDGQGLAVSGMQIALRLPVGFSPTPGSPLR